MRAEIKSKGGGGADAGKQAGWVPGIKLRMGAG